MGKNICGGAKPRMDIGDVKRDLLWGRLAGVGADEYGKRGVRNKS